MRPTFRRTLYQYLLNAIALHRVVDRPDRFEPRRRKRRPYRSSVDCGENGSWRPTHVQSSLEQLPARGRRRRGTRSRLNYLRIDVSVFEIAGAACFLLTTIAGVRRTDSP